MYLTSAEACLGLFRGSQDPAYTPMPTGLPFHVVSSLSPFIELNLT